jgi:hypothetical protein
MTSVKLGHIVDERSYTQPKVRVPHPSHSLIVRRVGSKITGAPEPP